MKKIIILGGSGFIGSNLVKEMAKQGVSLAATYFRNLPKQEYKNVEWIKVDLRDAIHTEQILNGYDEVYHCAAVTSGAGIIKSNPLIHLHDNLLINTNVARSLIAGNGKRIIFISSSVVYPELSCPVAEGMESGIFSASYKVAGKMKLMSEEIFQLTCNEIKGINKSSVIIIRPSNVYGPGDKFDYQTAKALPSLIRRAIETSDFLEVWGNGDDSRDMIYIDDFISAVLKFEEYKGAGIVVYNIATEQNVTITEIAQAILIALGKNIAIKYSPEKPSTIKMRAVSSALFKAKFSWTPKVNLEQGIINTINWYKESLNVKS